MRTINIAINIACNVIYSELALVLTAQFGRIGCGSLRAISSAHLFLILDSLLLPVSEIVFPFAGIHFRLHPLSEIHFSLRNSFSSAPSTPQAFRTALLSTNLSFSISSLKYISSAPLTSQAFRLALPSAILSSPFPLRNSIWSAPSAPQTFARPSLQPFFLSFLLSFGLIV